MGADSNVVVSSQPASEHIPRQQKLSVRYRIVEGTHFWASRFFPWSADNSEVKLQHLTHARYVPWWGLLALVASGMTVLFSWIVLVAIDGQPQQKIAHLKPASWLSGILSVNSIFLRVALNEGVTTAWWFAASRKNATVRDIHDAWSLGQSLGAVLLSGKRFNYIALATLFVASIPLNGLLLQTAITTVQSVGNSYPWIYLGIANTLPAGFSAQLSDGLFVDYQSVFAVAVQTMDQDTSFSTDPIYINESPTELNGPGPCSWADSNGTCYTRIVSPGFVSDCTDLSVPFDISPETHKNQPFSGKVLYSHLDWNASAPNIFNFTILVKDSNSCVGNYNGRQCIFRAAQLSYPVESLPCPQLGQQYAFSDIASGGCFSLNFTSNYTNDTLVSYLPAPSEVDSLNSTFGGVAHYLQSIYNTDLEWAWNGSNWSINATGRIAENAVIASPQTAYGTVAFYNTSLENPDFCKNALDYFGTDNKSTTIEITLHNRLRNLMFFSSLMQFVYIDQFTDNDQVSSGQYVLTERITQVLRYKVHYWYWAASLATTVTIILMITPTFWGFWRLRGKVSLSPVDTAVVLNAPILHTEREVEDTEIRLNEVGERPLYSDGERASSHDGTALIYGPGW